MATAQAKPTTRQVRAAQTAEELKSAARAVFARQGYLNTKIADITGEAGRAAGSFYNHFSTKEDVLAALAFDIGQVADVLVEERTDPVSAGSDHDAVLSSTREHVAVFWHAYAANRDVFEAIDQASMVNAEFANRMRQLRREQFEPWVAWLADVAHGGGRLPADPEITAEVIAATTEAMIRRWPSDAETGIERLSEFFTSGIQAMAGPRPAPRPDRGDGAQA